MRPSFRNLTVLTWLLFGVVSRVAAAAGAQTTLGCAGGRGSFTWENDGQFWILRSVSTDHFYTNGLRLSSTVSENDDGIHPRQPGSLMTQRAGLWLSRFAPRFGDESCIDGTVEYGQVLYTPTNLRRTEPSIGERPYAAWAWATIRGGRSSAYRESDATWNRVPLLRTEVGLTVGLMGQGAGGKAAQTFAHRLLRSMKGEGPDGNPPNPLGWHNQITNHLTLMGSGSIRAQIPGFEKKGFGRFFTGSVSLTSLIGTPLTEGQARLSTALGYNLGSDFGPGDNIASVAKGAPKPEPRPKAPVWAGITAGVFWSGTARYTARNDALDCRQCLDRYRIDRDATTSEWEWGIRARFRGFGVTWRRIQRTADFVSLVPPAHKPQGLRFGSWNFEWTRAPKSVTKPGA